MTSVNRCANSVVSSFNALSSSPSGLVRYKSQGGHVLAPSNARLAEFGSWDDHVQSITRLPGVGDNRWAAVTRAKPSTVQDYADLFKVTWNPAGAAVQLTLMSARNMNEGSGGYCTFRAAANIHVDKNGKLILYCHTHHSNTDIFGNPDSKLKLAEYAQP